MVYFKTKVDRQWGWKDIRRANQLASTARGHRVLY